MIEHKSFGYRVGYTIFYNDTIISIEEADMCRLQYICYVHNYDEKIYLDWLFVEHLFHLQETIKKIKERD